MKGFKNRIEYIKSPYSDSFAYKNSIGYSIYFNKTVTICSNVYKTRKKRYI